MAQTTKFEGLLLWIVDTDLKETHQKHEDK